MEDILNFPLDSKLILRKKNKIKRELLEKNSLFDLNVAILGGSTTDELKNILGENYKSKAREVKHTYDKTGKSINLEIYFTPIDNDDFWPAQITCTNWSKKYEKKNSENFSTPLRAQKGRIWGGNGI